MASDFFLSHLSVSTRLWAGQPVEAMAASLMRLGIVHLELVGDPMTPGHFNPDGNNDRLFNMLAEAGSSPAVLRLTGMTYEQKLRSIEEAAGRGIPAVVDRAEMLCYPDLLHRVYTYATKAGNSGIHLFLENEYYSQCDSAEAQQTIGRSVAHPALSFAFSPPAALANDLNPADEVRRLGSGLQLAYLWDASPRMVVGKMAEDFDPGPVEEQIPGHAEGQLNWAEYFQALAEIRFRGIFGLHWSLDQPWEIARLEEAIRGAIRHCQSVTKELKLNW